MTTALQTMFQASSPFLVNLGLWRNRFVALQLNLQQCQQQRELMLTQLTCIVAFCVCVCVCVCVVSFAPLDSPPVEFSRVL